MNDKVKEILPYIIILLVVILIKTFLFTTVRVNGSSMMSTLHDGDIMVMNKIVYNYKDIKRFDIVVADVRSSKIIKRVIGLPGEVVEYRNNVLYIDEKIVEDKYNKIFMPDFIYSLNEDEYFVMGDNRDDSLDSRVLGSINKKDIMGRASLVFYPLNRIGLK